MILLKLVFGVDETFFGFKVYFGKSIHQIS